MGGIVSFFGLNYLIQEQCYILCELIRHRHYIKYLDLHEYYDQEESLFNSLCKSEGFPVMEDYYCHMNKIINKKLHGTKKLQNTFLTIFRNIMKSQRILKKHENKAETEEKKNKDFERWMIAVIRISFELHFIIEIIKKSDDEIKKYIKIYILEKQLRNKHIKKLCSRYNLNT